MTDEVAELPPEIPKDEVVTHWMPPVAVELAIGTVPFAPGVGMVCDTRDADAIPMPRKVETMIAALIRYFFILVAG